MLFSERRKFLIGEFAGTEKKVFAGLELEDRFGRKRRFENEENWSRNWDVLLITFSKNLSRFWFNYVNYFDYVNPFGENDQFIDHFIFAKNS